MTSIKIIGNSTPFSTPRLEEIIIGNFFTSMEYTQGGIVLVRITQDEERRRIETFLPYHRVWEIETIKD